jgi:hypothetical protein
MLVLGQLAQCRACGFITWPETTTAVDHLHDPARPNLRRWARAVTSTEGVREVSSGNDQHHGTAVSGGRNGR